MNANIKRETRCDKCQRLFYRKLRPAKEKGGPRELTQLNKVSYWTGGKAWNNYRILCRVCLNDWFEKYRGDFAALISKEKQKLYYHYRYIGHFNKKREMFKRE